MRNFWGVQCNSHPPFLRLCQFCNKTHETVLIDGARTERDFGSGRLLRDLNTRLEAAEKEYGALEAEVGSLESLTSLKNNLLAYHDQLASQEVEILVWQIQSTYIFFN